MIDKSNSVISSETTLMGTTHLEVYVSQRFQLYVTSNYAIGKQDSSKTNDTRFK